MTENRARYIALIVISLEAIIAFVLFGSDILGRTLPLLYVEGSKLSLEVIIFLLVFLGIGLIIIFSTFFKTAFYVFTAVELMLATYYTLSSAFQPLALLLWLALLAPQLFYYTALIIINKKPGVHSGQ